MNHYRAVYRWPDGRDSHVHFNAMPLNASQWAEDYVKYYIQGELLDIVLVRPVQDQLELEAPAGQVHAAVQA